jgi:predicted MFS family arabinose efflux permease
MAKSPQRGDRRHSSAVAVAVGLATGPAVALGFTRFAYALLLSPMREELGWSYAAAGGMNTANAVGYVLGAATAAWWARRIGSRAAFGYGMVLSALALLGSAATVSYPLLAALRLLGGVGTAVVFVVGSVLAARILVAEGTRRSTLPVAFYMAGVGIGVVLSGIVVPASLTWLGTSGWRVGWLVLGVLAALAVAPAVWAARRVPEPHLRSGPAATGASPTRMRAMAPTIGWYVFFGAGYISYMTFIVALLRVQGLRVWSSAAFFIVLGATSAVATLLVWGPIIGRLRGGRATASVSAVVLVGVLPVLLWPGLGGALVSAAVFGSGFMAGPTAVTVLARRMLAPHVWASGIAVLTVAFSIGQAAGPTIVGFVADGSTGITGGLWLSVGLLAAATATALAQRERPARKAADWKRPPRGGPAEVAGPAT